MSGRAKALTILLAIAYGAGVVYFFASANARRSIVPVPDYVETELAIPDDEFKMFGLELEQYIVVDDGAGGKAAPGELLKARHMQELRELGIDRVKVKDQRAIQAFVKRKLVALADVKRQDGQKLIDAGTVLGEAEVKELLGEGARWVRAQGHGSIVGLNATMLFVVLNFVVLTVFLYQLMWKPVVRSYDAREENISGAARAARKAVSRAEEVKKERDELDYETRRERMRIIGKWTIQARTEDRETVSRARAEADRLRDEGQETLATSIEGLRREMEPQIPSLAAEVAAKLLGREFPREMFEAAEARKDEGGDA